ncbi:hypothetical protein RB598_009546 [Gaeumannomyces tritici]
MSRIPLRVFLNPHPKSVQRLSTAAQQPTSPSASTRAFWMPRKTPTGSPRTSVEEFQDLLGRVVEGRGRVLALCGAGLSASSGLLTFRGKGGMWRDHRSTDLATPEAFAENPGLVWLFYAWRRHRALSVQPNAAHYALARLATRLTPPPPLLDDDDDSADDATTKTAKTRFLCLTQNVDGLSQRAGHPPASLRPVHGRLFDLKCFDGCGYVERDNFSDPLCPALAPSSADPDPDWIVDGKLPAPQVAASDLPACPRCAKDDGKAALLRPDVVWFGEPLEDDALAEADAFVCGSGGGGGGGDPPPPVELMLVVGTAATVHPAAGYIDLARRHGAVVAVVNPDPDAGRGLGADDFFFAEDAAEVLPRLVEKVAGMEA